MYELYYWPGIPGRGEFIRLALEDAGAEYVDIGRRDGAAAVARLLDSDNESRPPFAPPILRIDGLGLVSHVAHILQIIGPQLALAPDDPKERAFGDGMQLTLTDFVSEIHDIHHPLGPELHYEQQTAEAQRRAVAFRTNRLPKFLGYFENVLAATPATPWLIGKHATTADFYFFQTIAGLRYALPMAMTELDTTIPRINALHDAVAARPGIATYLQSDRRQPFNNSGLFRRYPELDGPVQT